MSSDSYFEGDFDDGFEGKKTVSGIKYGNKYGLEGEVLGNTYGSVERRILGESALGIVMGKKMG